MVEGHGPCVLAVDSLLTSLPSLLEALLVEALFHLRLQPDFR